MKALLITSGNGFSEKGSYNVASLKRALEAKGVTTLIFGNETFASLDDITDTPDIAYITYMLPENKLDETKRFRDRGVFFVNSPEAVSLCSDKMKIYDKMVEANISHPKTIIVDDNTNFENLNLDWPCVLKPNIQFTTTPCAGLDVLFCSNPMQMKNNFDILKSRHNDTVKLMAQEYIESGDNDMLISSWVFGDTISSFISIADPTPISEPTLEDKFKSHRAVGHQRVPIATSENLLNFIGQIRSAIDANVFRIEVYYKNNGYEICKIKVPGDRLVHDATVGIDSSTIIADYIIRRYNEQ